jgi:hypothetical protein
LWEEVFNENGLYVGNDGHPTNFRTKENHEGDSVSELTLANRLIMKWYIQVDDHATGTDHGDMEWEEAIDRQK